MTEVTEVVIFIIGILVGIPVLVFIVIAIGEMIYKRSLNPFIVLNSIKDGRNESLLLLLPVSFVRNFRSY